MTGPGSWRSRRRPSALRQRKHSLHTVDGKVVVRRVDSTIELACTGVAHKARPRPRRQGSPLWPVASVGSGMAAGAADSGAASSAGHRGAVRVFFNQMSHVNVQMAHETSHERRAPRTTQQLRLYYIREAVLKVRWNLESEPRQRWCLTIRRTLPFSARGLSARRLNRGHSPRMQSPRMQSPRVQSPRMQSPRVQSPRVQSPRMQSPRVQSPRVQSPRSTTTSASHRPRTMPRIERSKAC